MSKYMEIMTKITEETHLIAALKEMGFSPIVHAEPVQLKDWHGIKRPDRAQIVIDRHNTGLGASNDIGFIKENGSYRAIISEYDARNKFGERWMGKLAQTYTTLRTLSVARQKGYILQSRTVTDQGKIQMKFMVR